MWNQQETGVPMTTSVTMTDILLTEDGNYIFCEDCGKEFAIHEFVGSDDKVFKLCETCRDEAQQACDDMREIEEEEDRRKEEEEEDEYYRDDLGQCESCQKEKAVIVFMHLYNGNFELCKDCFDWADHERDYGKDFKKREEEEKSLMETIVGFLRG